MDAEDRAKRRSRMRLRFIQAGWQQGRHGLCLICRKGWDDCPHTHQDIEDVAQELRRGDTRERFGI